MGSLYLPTNCKIICATSRMDITALLYPISSRLAVTDFARLFIEKTIWTAQGKDPEKYALADLPEEAVARLWLALHKKIEQ